MKTIVTIWNLERLQGQLARCAVKIKVERKKQDSWWCTEWWESRRGDSAKPAAAVGGRPFAEHTSWSQVVQRPYLHPGSRELTAWATCETGVLRVPTEGLRDVECEAKGDGQGEAPPSDEQL